MSELFVITFDQKHGADEALLALLKLEQSHLSDLEDAVIVVKDAAGKVRVKACHDLLEPVAELSNELWGGVLSALVFHRSITLTKEVFDSHLLLEIEEDLQPKTSALLVLVRPDAIAQVEVNFAQIGGKVFRMPLSEATQAKLKSLFSS